MDRKSGDIFEGKALIDRLLVYFAKFEGSREKAQRYAQKLLELGHIESLDKSTAFEDSNLQYQWTDVARVVNKAKSKLADSSASSSDIETSPGRENSRKPVVRISIEADNFEGAEIRAHIRASPVTYSKTKDMKWTLNNCDGFCSADVQNGKMISFLTETSKTEEVLRMIPVSSTVEKFEKLRATVSDNIPQISHKAGRSNEKHNDDKRNGLCDSKTVAHKDGTSSQRNIDLDGNVSAVASPGKGETSSKTQNNSAVDINKEIEDSQHHLHSHKECTSPLGSRTKSEPTIKKQSYVFSEKNYLQDSKPKPITSVTKGQNTPKDCDIATPNGEISETRDKVKIQTKSDGSREDNAQKKDFAEDKGWMKLRQDFLANKEIRNATGYSGREHHTDMFDGTDASFLHSTCVPETIEEDSEVEDYEGMENPKENETIILKPVVHVSPPPPSPAIVEKYHEQAMKSLFWTKISCASGPLDQNDGVFWLNTDRNVKFDKHEFVKLFSKPATTIPQRSIALQRSRQEESSSGSKTLKVLGDERSRQIGIRASSFRLPPEDIHDAIINMDDAQLDLDALDALYDVRPTPDELDDIADALKKYPDGILDKPEQFVLMMAMIGNLDERLKSWIFMMKFPDRVLDIKDQLKTLSNVCVQVVKNHTLQRLFEATLVFGNFMNKGTQRGDADGFHLDVLPKIKDVKSQGGDSNLMLYLVRWLMSEHERDGTGDLVQRRRSVESTISKLSEEDDCGLPSQTHLVKVCSTSFQDMKEEIECITAELCECKEQLIPAVIEGGTCIAEIKPFSERMKQFVEQAEEAVADLKKLVDDTAEVADEFKRYYMPFNTQSDSCVGLLKHICTFCQDFRFYWDDEKRSVAKEAFFSTEKARRLRIAAVKIGKSPSALKARFLQKRRRERGISYNEIILPEHDGQQNGFRRHEQIMGNADARTNGDNNNNSENVKKERQATPAVRTRTSSHAHSKNTSNVDGNFDRNVQIKPTGGALKLKEAMAKRRIMLKSKTT